MQLENSFTVPVPIDEAWRVLLDIERIAPCMPGAALDTVDGDDFTGRVKVKLGPINLTYQGKASFIEKDEAAVPLPRWSLPRASMTALWAASSFSMKDALPW